MPRPNERGLRQTLVVEVQRDRVDVGVLGRRVGLGDAVRRGVGVGRALVVLDDVDGVDAGLQAAAGYVCCTQRPVTGSEILSRIERPELADYRTSCFDFDRPTADIHDRQICADSGHS